MLPVAMLERCSKISGYPLMAHGIHPVWREANVENHVIRKVEMF